MSAHLDGKNLIELLNMLEPVADPPAVSLMPQTPGWIVLGIVLIGALIWVVRLVRARHHTRAYRRAALKELANAGNDTARIAALLRRTALAGYPRDQVAGLVGADWLSFLNQSCDNARFAGDIGQELLSAPYRRSTTNPTLAALARDWITHHRQLRP